ncbi:hypothetical protein HY416_01725 [Candidatus Kaiserbacteria bacterium]|nr:hypothetical protein [Candidatus Kaiserbacteria bacterium]
MTWSKATPALVISGIFDALRLMFVGFIFFGPALAGLYCDYKVSDWIGPAFGLTTAGCAAGAATLGFFGAPAFMAFGTVMAMATGFAGWLAVGLILLMFNSRIFKENALWFVGSLLFSEIPFIGAIPAITVSVWKMHSHQIKTEKEAYKKWQKENAAAQLAERNQRAAQSQAAQQAQQEVLDQEWENQMGQQEEQETEDGETNRTIAEATLPNLRLDTKPLPSPSVRQTPPPLPISSQSVPPPLPQEYLKSVPPPLPAWARSTPPPLPIEIHNYASATQPPPLPPQPVRYTNTSGMKDRPTMNSDERSVEQVALRNNAFIVHTIAESGQAQHHNENSNVSGKVTYGDDMDIMLAFEPSVSASSVTPGKKARLWTGDGFILGGGQISEAGGSDQGTVAHGIKRRGNRTSSLEEIDHAVGRNSELHKRDYDRIGTFGMNEIVVNNSEVFGFFQQAEKDADGRYWMFSAETKKDAEMAKKMRRYGPTAFDNNLGNYRRRFSTAQERGIPLYVMTPEREVYEALGVNDDGTVEIGKQLTPEEVARGRAGLSAEKRKEIGERILKKNLFRGEKIQKEAEEIIKSL